MQVQLSIQEDQATLTITGMLKKADGMKVADEITKAGRQHPKKLTLDCNNLVALSLDSIPFIVSALERLRLGKTNVRAVGCNSVVERSFRGFDFERIGQLE